MNPMMLEWTFFATASVMQICVSQGENDKKMSSSFDQFIPDCQMCMGTCSEAGYAPFNRSIVVCFYEGGCGCLYNCSAVVDIQTSDEANSQNLCQQIRNLWDGGESLEMPNATLNPINVDGTGINQQLKQDNSVPKDVIRNRNSKKLSVSVGGIHQHIDTVYSLTKTDSVDSVPHHYSDDYYSYDEYDQSGWIEIFYDEPPISGAVIAFCVLILVIILIGIIMSLYSK